MSKQLTYGGVAPGALPVLGHLLSLRFRPFDFLASLPAAGDLLELRIGPQRALIVTHPDLVWQVLADGKTFDKGGLIMEEARHYLGDGLSMCDFEKHRRDRKVMAPIFDHGRVRRYLEITTDVVSEFTDSWHDGMVVDLTAEMMKLTGRNAARTITAAALGPAADEIGAAQLIMSEEGYKHITSPLRIWSGKKVADAPTMRFSEANARIDRLVDSVLEQHGILEQHRVIRQREGDADFGDMVSVVLAGGQAANVSREWLQCQIVNLLAAAGESLGCAVSWILQMIARHPDVAARLREETDRVLDGRLPQWEDTPKLTLVNQVVREALRVWPPAWLLTRQVTTDTVLAGHPVPAGSTIFFSAYTVHHREDLYHDAGSFNPDRWQPGFAQSLPNGAYLPFGGGTRKCIGEELALAEAAVIVASIIGRWQFEPAQGTWRRPRVRTRLLLRPGELHVRLRKGTKALPEKVREAA